MAKVVFSDGSKAWANNLNDLRERWHLRREEPVRFVVSTNLFRVDIEMLERDDLLKLQVALIELQNGAKQALLNAQLSKRYEATRMGRDEYSDLLETKNAIGAHIQEVNHALSKLNRKRKESLMQIFMDVCREKLTEETWKEIMDEANERLRAGSGGALIH